MIQKFYIQKLRDLDILRVADALGMGLRHKRALCIQHDDHHPSLMFNVRKNTCHCYSCGFSADTISLVMKRLNLGFMEACRWLANQFDVYIGDEEKEGARGRSRQDRSMAMDAQAKLGPKAVDPQVVSLANIDPKMVSRENIGPKMVGRENVDPKMVSRENVDPKVDVEYYSQLFVNMAVSASGLKFLFEQRMLSPEVVKQCHIVSSETNVCMSRVGRSVFEGPMLLFPYLGVDGSLMSVQSRYLGDDKEIPRFKFAPGSHRMVYGLDHLAGYPPQEPLLITEGPSDCWAALTLGFHAIAIPSATLFDKQLQPLLEGRNLHMFPDQDVPGLSLYFELKSVFPQLVYHQLPEGCKDLSDYYLRLRHGGMSLEEAKASVRASPR